MGLTFSNIHLKKNEKCNENSLTAYFQEEMDISGYEKTVEFKEANYIFMS